MTIHDAIAPVSFLAMDTAPINCYMEKDIQFYPLVEPVFTASRNNHLLLVTSTLTLTEVLVKPLRDGDNALVSEYQGLLRQSREMANIPVSSTIAECAADLRARYRLKLADATILATAIEEGCDAVLTGERDWKRVREIPVLCLGDLTL